MVNSFFDYLKKNQKILLSLLLAVLGVALIFSSSLGSSDKQDDGKDEKSLEEYGTELEEELRSLCASVDGVGKCRVFITFERGEERVYKGSSLIEVKPPQVQGVTVVCRGADNDTVRCRITEMITALFDIGSNRVAVMKLNS